MRIEENPFFVTFSNFYLIRSDALDGKVTMDFFACNFSKNMKKFFFLPYKNCVKSRKFSSVSQKLNGEKFRKKSGLLTLTGQHN